ncbi:LRR receptor-like serine/threonine-protein kinase RCH1 [Morus notabilis]|uniref:non-specific serine/threonine protein kinase n=1 Tax=Morus notabilis TaxID=981085 RepID=W9SDK8_9ROSA|nr:LRR receptor-like serine/threonine-protein kinase RCH1 [Morus notabilis]
MVGVLRQNFQYQCRFSFTHDLKPMPGQFLAVHHHFCSHFLIILSLLLSAVFVSANNEVSALYSWLHASPSFSSSFSNWNPSDPNPCNWSYINCSSENFVTEINIQSVELAIPFPSNLSSFPYLEKLVISDANLTGSISSDIQYCTELTVIDVSSNSLVGNIPSSIGKLRNLQDLILNSNQLTGQIPRELGECTNLKNLLVFDNYLSGNLPAEIGKLLKLEVIRAGGNKDIEGKIPDKIGDCRNLKVLGLADTKIAGSLPASLGKLSMLQTLSVYTTMLSGEIPPEIGNCSELVDLFLYENDLFGSLPPELGKLQKLEKMLLWQNNFDGTIPEEIAAFYSCSLMLTPAELGLLTQLNVFFAWQNKLEGSIPSTLAGCKRLQALDLSHNELTSSLPPGLFELQNLTKLLLISNHISGSIPPEIGKCKSLIRLRLLDNRISGEIPREIGSLNSLSFLDLSQNRLSGSVPAEIGNCAELQLLNLSNNTLGGNLPSSLSFLTRLQVLDISANQFIGKIPENFGRLSSLNRLVLSINSFSGSIPSSLGQCSSLQLLDLGSNNLTGAIPVELFQLEALEIALNLSFNGLSGVIPPQVSSLNKLSVLDLSHNKLEGGLLVLSSLENLVSLNISYNNFTGYLPDNKLFRQLSTTDLEGNQGLCSKGHDLCFLSNGTTIGIRNSSSSRNQRRFKLAISLLITLTVALAISGALAVFRARKMIRTDDNDSEMGSESWPWQFIPFQKVNFTVEQVLKCLTEPNVIGKGCSGIVYKAELDNGEVIAVKKLWPTTISPGYHCRHRDSFSAEVKTLGSIRHKNIVRFLGCCWNKKTRLLMYDYVPNGSLGSLLHERSGGNSICLEWELRYRIVLGSAQGLAYLHHDCVPPIVHRDIKANNILIGPDFEPYIADFGLAKLVHDGDFARSSNIVAGSYGYIAPEYGYMMKITEKSDVYSYGVVVLEVLTGKQPIDPTIPEGLHIVDWVIRQRRLGTFNVEVLDPSLRGRPESEIEEMIQTLGVALLCVNPSPDDRPTMKDVAAMLKEIRQDREDQCMKVDHQRFLTNGCSKSDDHRDQCKRESKNFSGSSSYPQSNNTTSFSVSSNLLYSSSSSAK